MHEEPEPLDVDARVRAALAPDDEAARRIVARALAAREAAPRRRRQAALAAGIAAALLVAAGARLSRSRRAPAPPPREQSLAVSGQGRMVVVEREDGRRWIVGPPAPAGHGGYVIFVASGRE